MKKTVALVILDGWGLNESKEGNAVLNADTPNFDNYISKYPNMKINASGLAVGLPDGQMGNSEVGHLNIGAGRVVYQEYTRISKSIKDKDFFENEELNNAINNAKKNKSSLHLLGLLSDGGVHSHIDHIKGLLKLAKMRDLKNVYLHAFMDGRDTSPNSGLEHVKEIEKYMKTINCGSIATISGRYYAMDRDNRWERIELAYDALVRGEGKQSDSAFSIMEKTYKNGITDEFILPSIIQKNGEPIAKIKNDDSVIFFNFRPDRARQITKALVEDEFNHFKRERLKLYYVTITKYDDKFKNVKIAYDPQKLENTLGEYLANNGKTQLRIAETEKYAHVTFFFNGGVEKSNKSEDRILISSPKVASYDLQPEMSAYELADKALEEIDKEKYDFIVLNFANADMVGHTGDFKAATKAIEAVDYNLGRIVDKMLSKGGKMIITADHGNAEYMIDEKNKEVFTAHTTNPVPLIVVGEENIKIKKTGKLSDIAPTLLDMMDLKSPDEFTGEKLFKRRKI